MDMTSVKDGTPAPTLCGDIFKIIDGSGKSAIKQSCAFLDNGTGRHKITFQITGDTTQPNKRARYIEQGSFYFCTSAGISATDLSNCALISGTPSDFSVYGTTFDIGKHAWKFANGSWMNTSGQPSKFYAANSSSWWVFKNNFYKAASVIQSYIRYADIADFWNSIGYGAYNVRTGSKLYQHKSDGLCYGLANSAIAGYSHQDSSTTWGIRDFTQANWSADILSRWDDSTKTTSPFSPLFAPDENIYTAPSLNDLSTIWTINSAKKIMYYFVTHPAWSGQNWVGKDSTQNLNASSESTFIKILKGGAPVSLYIREVQGSEPKGYHEVAVPQLLIWNGHRYLMIWDNNYPLGRLSNAFGPYTSLYFDSTNSYDPTKMTRYEIISTETSDAYLYNNLFLANYAFLSPGCSDSQNIYNQWTAPCTTFQASSEQANAPDVSDYPYPNHIQVLIIGAQLNSVYDQTTSSSPTLVPGGDVITGQAVQTVSGDGLFTTLYLPATDTYQIQATKYAGFTGLTVLVTIPNTDGTAQLLNYNNMSTGDANTTHITFTVGRGNTNTGVVRTIANDTYNPDYNGTLPTALNPPTGLKAVVNNSGTGVALSWTNTSNLLLASVLVIRKAGSVPTSTTDGVTVYSGTGQGVTDNTVTANTVYYYAAYSFDHSSNPSDPAVIQVDTTLRSIYGTISVSGGGLAGAVLQLLDSNSKLVSSTSSAADGTYAISNIANGSYTLTASSSTAAITNPSVPVAISGTSHEVDFSATNQKTLFLLYDAPSVAVGDTVSISWAYRNISNSETVNITLLRSGVWETIASGVPILNGTVSWTVTSPNVTSATLKISLASDSTVNAQFTFAIAPGYDFLGVPVSGAAPLAVNFADQSLGSMAWLWNFGDGATSTVQNPLHMYSSSGTYNVSLTATGSSGQTTITKNSYVSVSGTCNALPVTIADTNDYYSSIENALNYAGNGATLQLQAVPLTDSPNIARNISFKLSGGYGCDYSMNPGYTIVSGVMTISQGTVIMENIIVK
ncbi:MAG: PKD domain-containing protein [Desulfuromonadales bacterium]|nr:PKD domain-containing protein [Desulfuromonadales bacterium]